VCEDNLFYFQMYGFCCRLR